ncbi:metal cation symporter ZIP14-like [Patiria miniata]|uniref:Zinc transporter ZIP12 n=1 Tax=Patiria miniata TaxID=46514 RepID=A0A913ZMX2_PATMI|nr:metal cation symporter ZIP14-like [Patiria miniata]
MCTLAKMASIRVLDFRAVCTVYLLVVFGIFGRLHVLGVGEDSADGTHDEHGHSESVFGDPFEEILGRLKEVSLGVDRNITRDETSAIIQSLFEERMQCSVSFNRTNCQKCLDADDLFSILGVQTSDGLDEENFNRACVVLLYYVNDLEATCANATLSAQVYDYFAREIQTRLDSTPRLSEEELEAVLGAVAGSYKANNFAKCFTVETVFEAAVSDHEAGADDHELEEVAAILISSLVRGFCIGNATAVDPEAFLEDIFDHYAAGSYMSEEEFQVILDKLSAGSQEDTHDNHDHARRRRGADSNVLAGKTEQRRRRRNVETVTDSGHDHDHDHAHEGEMNLDIHSCFSVDELFEIFDVNHSVGVTRQQFKELSPALIQQKIGDACAEPENVPSRPTAAEVWGYGVLAVFIISLCAVAGVAFLPCLNTALYLKVLQTMMALAVATLIGDAVIHLIPQAVGLHAHDATSSADAHVAGSAELAYIWKCLVVVGAIYIFFLFESLMQIFGGGHSHSVEPDDDPTKRKRASSMKLKEAVDGSFMNRSSSTTQLEMSNGNLTDAEANDSHGHEHGQKQKVCFGMGTLPFMILIGDGLHNLGDGLAIGAAFATSLGAGLSTSIAVLCHELPHELGDFAVLLNAGLSFRKALCFNFLSACMAFVGLCIGIPLAANEEAREWIFAVAAGMFLYVALVDMLPELIHHENKNKAAIFLLHNVGFLAGAAIILLIALYEDSINIIIN